MKIKPPPPYTSQICGLLGIIKPKEYGTIHTEGQLLTNWRAGWKFHTQHSLQQSVKQILLLLDRQPSPERQPQVRARSASSGRVPWPRTEVLPLSLYCSPLAALTVKVWESSSLGEITAPASCKVPLGFRCLDCSFTKYSSRPASLFKTKNLQWW